MSAVHRLNRHLVRDARADWRRWSIGERIAACTVAALLGAGGPVFLVVLALPWPM
jgi:hypothetical protein